MSYKILTWVSTQLASTLNAGKATEGGDITRRSPWETLKSATCAGAGGILELGIMASRFPQPSVAILHQVCLPLLRRSEASTEIETTD